MARSPRRSLGLLGGERCHARGLRGSTELFEALLRGVELELCPVAVAEPAIGKANEHAGPGEFVRRIDFRP